MRPAVLGALLALAGAAACHPPMWRAPSPAPGESSAVASLVLVGRDKGCQCTREDVQRAWRALGTVLGARRERLVRRVDWDRERAAVQRLRAQRRFIALPALYVLDAKGRVLGLLEGDLQPRWIRELLRQPGARAGNK